MVPDQAAAPRPDPAARFLVRDEPVSALDVSARAQVLNWRASMVVC